MGKVPSSWAILANFQKKVAIFNTVWMTFCMFLKQLENTKSVISNIWLFCTVYPTSKPSVQKKVLELVNNFNKLIKYPKVKLGPSYEEKVKEFARNSETLIDVFCCDEKK